MFRGIGLVTFRRMGLTEARVALYSSVVFGAVHLSNALATGTSAIFQAIIVSFTGYMLYLTRRWAGAIWLAMPVHASQDFLIISGQIGVDAARLAAVVRRASDHARARDPALAPASPHQRRTLPGGRGGSCRGRIADVSAPPAS